MIKVARKFALAVGISLCFASFVMADSQPKIVAHRGNWHAANGAQNSVEALRKAAEAKAYASEFDVWLTADDSLVVNHDRTVGGITIEEATMEQVATITLPNGEKLPTLDQYLRAAAELPDLRLVLELKEHSDLNREDKAVGMILDRLEKYGLMDRTDIISFSINACLEFRKRAPQLDVYYLYGDLSPKRIKSLGLAGIDYSGRILKNHLDWIKEAHEAGLKVNVWTIDSSEDKEFFAEQGVDFITTNTPTSF